MRIFAGPKKTHEPRTGCTYIIEYCIGIHIHSPYSKRDTYELIYKKGVICDEKRKCYQ